MEDKEVEELYLDIQGATPEKLAELFARIGAGFLLAWFSIHELLDELREHRNLRLQQRRTAA